MQVLDWLTGNLSGLLPLAVEITVVLVALFAIRRLLEKRYSHIPDRHFRFQMIMVGLTLIGLLVVIMSLPIGDVARGQLLSLVGIVLSAAIALSSTTFIGNAMAGLMLRAVRSFRAGDFIRVGEHFGRVSERDLFHVEIQTEDRDLTTLPNLYLVTNPVTVVRSSGTIVSATLSLGYDVPHAKIEECLLKAAERAELQEPFVHVNDLGDFSVTYRIAGLLPKVKQLLSARSRLRTMVLEELHSAGIEIVSPTFMNTRAIREGYAFIPPMESRPAKTTPRKPAPESIAFDKAEKAESLANLQSRFEDLQKKLKELEEEASHAEKGPERDGVKAKIARLEERKTWLKEVLETRMKSSKEEKD